MKEITEMHVDIPRERLIAEASRITRQAVAEQIRERVVVEAIAGAPAGMVAVYVAIEAEHLIAGHDGDAQKCDPCNEAGTAWIKKRRDAS